MEMVGIDNVDGDQNIEDSVDEVEHDVELEVKPEEVARIVSHECMRCRGRQGSEDVTKDLGGLGEPGP